MTRAAGGSPDVPLLNTGSQTMQQSTHCAACVAFVLVAGAAATAALAGDGGADEVVETEVADPVALLKAIRPGLDIRSVRSAPVDGLYQVEVGAEAFYISADGRYLIAGDMYRIDDDLRNVDEERRSRRRSEMIGALPADDAVTFAPPGGALAAVNVFTDVDCG